MPLPFVFLLRWTMGPTRSSRMGRRSPTTAGAAESTRRSATFRPRLELLEERVQLGDTILGLAAVLLGGLELPSGDTPFVPDSAEHDRAWHRVISSSQD